MKYIKTFEDNIKNKPIYSVDLIHPFINYFYNMYEIKMEEEGWFVSYASGMSIPIGYDVPYSNRVGSFWQVQKDDNSDLIENDIEAEKIAKSCGLMLDDYGVVIGYNGVSFLEHPEELEVYNNINKYNL